MNETAVSKLIGRAPEGSGFRVGLGIVGFAAVVALAISPLLSSAEREASGKGESSLSSHKYDDISIRRSMTLKEVEEINGVPASYIIKSLKLPETISEDERLGSLKQQYGFEIDDVRVIVIRYKNGT